MNIPPPQTTADTSKYNPCFMNTHTHIYLLKKKKKSKKGILILPVTANLGGVGMIRSYGHGLNYKYQDIQRVSKLSANSRS